jgi:PhnB protein
MKRMNPYIAFHGRTHEALSFYQSVFGGDLNIMSVGDCPPEVQAAFPAEMKEKAMHGQLDIDGHFALMGTDCNNPNGPAPSGTNISIAVDCADQAELEKFFGLLADGGSVTCPLGPAFWGGEFGMVTDKFGQDWLLTFAETHWAAGR